jgi:hypothetical protein
MKYDRTCHLYRPVAPIVNRAVIRLKHTTGHLLLSSAWARFQQAHPA